MNDLIEIKEVDGEPRVDSRDFSEKLGVEHKNTLEIIRKYQKKLEKYGKVTFRTEDITTENRGIRQTAVCYLNERQATFLVTLSRNSEKAVDLKQDLTDSYHFYKSKHSQQPALPQTYLKALRELADSVEKNIQLANKIQEDQPKVEFADNIAKSENSIAVREFAKVLCKNGYITGQNRLFKFLRDKDGLNLLISTKEPTQYAIDNGWLEVEEYTFTDSKEKERIVHKVLVTGKGQLYIEKKLKKLSQDN